MPGRETILSVSIAASSPSSWGDRAGSLREYPVLLLRSAVMDLQTDLLSLRPVLLPGDGGAVRVRRAIKARLEAESAGRSPTSEWHDEARSPR